MQQSLIKIMQKNIAVSVMITALFFGIFSGVKSVQAQTSNDLQVQISELLQIVASLQAQLAAMMGNSTPSSVNVSQDEQIKIGSSVKTTALLRVRTNAGVQSNLINSIAINTTGTVVNGPRFANGYTWWLVKYDNGTQGWSAGQWLNKTPPIPTEVLVPKVTVSSVSNNENPTVRGYAYNTNTVGFSVDQGDKIYGSGEIAVVNNVWSHRVRTDLESGSYNLTVYVDNTMVAETSFVIQSQDDKKTSFSNVSMDVSQYNDHSNMAIAEFDFGNQTDYTYEIDWGEGDQSKQSLRSRVVTICNSVWTCSSPAGQLHTYKESGSYNVKLYALVSKRGSFERILVSTKSITIDITTSKDETATYQGFINGRNFIITRNITRAAALENCLLNARNNVTSEIRCTWNNEEIHRTTSDQVNQDGNTQELQAIINDLIKQVTNKNLDTIIHSDGVIRSMSELELQKEISRLMAVIAEDVKEKNMQPPKHNAFACDRSVGNKLGLGALACYGMWDYGNDFGEDKFMCGSYGQGTTGCEIKAPMCTSGKAIASTYYSNSQLKGMSSSLLSAITANLKTDTTVVKNGVAGLWEYTCAAEEAGKAKKEMLSLVVLRMAAGIESVDLKYDVNKDGEITVADSLIIHRVSVGLTPVAPANVSEIQILIDEWNRS